MSIVIVLTPHGRRQQVRCQPNQTCMHILEEVCRRFTEFSPAEHELCHHRRVLDLTQMFRFAGLPNNAQLEMQAATRQRSADSDVTVQLQLVESGRREQADFGPDTTVLEIVRRLGGAEVLAADGHVRRDTVCVYMRTELWGALLEETTLRALGLTGGRAAIRLVHKDPQALRTQANVSVPLPAAVAAAAAPVPFKPAKPAAAAAESRAQHHQHHTDDQQHQHHHSHQQQPMDVDTNAPAAKVPSPSDRKKPKFEIPEPSGSKAPQSPPSRARSASPPPVPVPDAQIVGPRSACVYSLHDAALLQDQQRRPGDEDRFYEVSVNDLKVLLRDLRTQARGEEDAPLLTARMRELDDSQRTLTRLARYKRTVIRVQFADRLVLQGAFSAVDRVGAVREWVRGFVREEFGGRFDLFTTPPKRILSDDETLVEANCVPAAVLHFGRGASADPSQQILRAEYAGQLSSPDAAIQEAIKYRGLPNDVDMDDVSMESGTGASSSQQPLSPTRRQPQGGAFHPSSVASSTTTDGAGGAKRAPKWFKPTGK